MIKVMIAEDNVGINTTYSNFLTNDKSFKIVANTFDGEKTIEKYLELKPDLLILDLNLPKIDGIKILEALSEIPEEKKKCNVLVISGNNTYRKKLCNMKKVYMSIQKPVNYEMFLPIIEDFKKEFLSSNEITENDVKDLLIEFNISPYLKSSDILICATLKAVNCPTLLQNYRTLYQVVGKEKNMNYKLVQYSVRNSIISINNNISKEKFIEYFGDSIGNNIITPTIFFVKLIQYFENIKNHRY